MVPVTEARGQEWKVPVDTSYFRPGDDNWNLVESVLRNQPGNLLMLLNRGADPNAMAEGGMTALMIASEMGDSLLVRLLVVNGADLELTYAENTTPLIVSVLNQHFGITRYLLEKGADPDHRDDPGGSPLLYAAALNDYRTADLLLYYGASDSIRDKDGNTALMTAVFFGNLETADVLLQDGLTPDLADNRGFTPLMIATQQGNQEMVDLLLEYGAEKEKTDINNFTALAHAIRFHQPGIAAILIDSGANIQHLISPNRSLYDLAVQENQKKIQEMLQERGGHPAPGLNFSEVDIAWGNSFNGYDHLMQVRAGWMERKHGFFGETGFDFRPVYRKVQVEGGDQTLYQYREFRWTWAHGIGIEYGVYGALYGMLSFGSYRGLDSTPPPHYSLAPSMGLYMQGRIAGMKAGAERYQFGTLYEKPWKINITLYVRIHYRKPEQLFKEIAYESY
jgi:ankyrin repeat protein